MSVHPSVAEEVKRMGGEAEIAPGGASAPVECRACLAVRTAVGTGTRAPLGASRERLVGCVYLEPLNSLGFQGHISTISFILSASILPSIQTFILLNGAPDFKQISKNGFLHAGCMAEQP